MSALSGSTGDFSCTEPGCLKRFEKAQGLSMHQRRAHGIGGPQWSTNVRRTNDDAYATSGDPLQKKRGRPPGTPNKLPSADAVFERLGLATAALFPDGIPLDRLIEIAEWQKATLKFLARGDK